MSQTKNKHSVAVVYKFSKRTNKWRIVGYLSSRDEERGLDIRYDMAGYKVVAL